MGERGDRPVARTLAQLWQHESCAPPPLLTSFSRVALAAARQAAPGLPRGLLLDRLDADWHEAAQELDCRAIIGHYPLWNAALLERVHAAGWGALAYTVNDAHGARRLLDLGLDGLITDRIDQPPAG